MHQKDKKAYWRFTTRYNLLLLGGLYFLLLGLIICNAIDRFEGVINVWKLLLYLLTLVGSFGAWIYCIWKSWLLTSFDGSLRVATIEPPHLNWSSAMFRKRRTDNDEQTTEAGRDYHEVEAS